jgi:hypothetical protein
MYANTFSITCHDAEGPEWAESYHYHLAAARADELPAMVTMAIIRVISGSG